MDISVPRNWIGNSPLFTPLECMRKLHYGQKLVSGVVSIVRVFRDPSVWTSKTMTFESSKLNNYVIRLISPPFQRWSLQTTSKKTGKGKQALHFWKKGQTLKLPLKSDPTERPQNQIPTKHIRSSIESADQWLEGTLSQVRQSCARGCQIFASMRELGKKKLPWRQNYRMHTDKRLFDKRDICYNAG